MTSNVLIMILIIMSQWHFITRPSALGMSDPIKDQLIVVPFEYGQHTRNMVNIPEVWSTYQKYGQHTRNMVNVPEIGSSYQKYD